MDFPKLLPGPANFLEENAWFNPLLVIIVWRFPHQARKERPIDPINLNSTIFNLGLSMGERPISNREFSKPLQQLLIEKRRNERQKRRNERQKRRSERQKRLVKSTGPFLDQLRFFEPGFVV